ncbi:hypothetical protein O9992_11205 [Vibrio lentus]|nr:hypothetical protein [Vibrio lentus]
MGKNVGIDDHSEGKPLPLLYAMRNGSPNQANMIRGLIEKPQWCKERLDDIITML